MTSGEPWFKQPVIMVPAVATILGALIAGAFTLWDDNGPTPDSTGTPSMDGSPLSPSPTPTPTPTPTPEPTVSTTPPVITTTPPPGGGSGGPPGGPPGQRSRSTAPR